MQASKSFADLFERDILQTLQVQSLQNDEDEPTLISKLYVEEDYYKLKDYLCSY